MKYEVAHVKLVNCTSSIGMTRWLALVPNGLASENDLFWGDTCAEAHDAAQRYCDEQNAKAAKPKPPEGFAFSDKPGFTDSACYALAYDTVDGTLQLAPGPSDAAIPTDWEWLAPAALKRETRKEAEKRYREHYGCFSVGYDAFMLGAGFKP